MSSRPLDFSTLWNSQKFFSSGNGKKAFLIGNTSRFIERANLFLFYSSKEFYFGNWVPEDYLMTIPDPNQWWRISHYILTPPPLRTINPLHTYSHQQLGAFESVYMKMKRKRREYLNLICFVIAKGLITLVLLLLIFTSRQWDVAKERRAPPIIAHPERARSALCK